MSSHVKFTMPGGAAITIYYPYIPIPAAHIWEAGPLVGRSMALTAIQ